jgi:hypothetical protein
MTQPDITPERLEAEGFRLTEYGNNEWELRIRDQTIEVWSVACWWLWRHWTAQLIDADQLTESRPIAVTTMTDLRQLIGVLRGNITQEARQ